MIVLHNPREYYQTIIKQILFMIVILIKKTVTMIDDMVDMSQNERRVGSS